MNISHLRYFVKLVKVGQLTKAATELYITQPALSSAIRTLEHELDFELFRKRGRNLILTKSGEIFFDHALRGLEIIDEGAQLGRVSSETPADLVRIGAEFTVRNEYLKLVTKTFSEELSPNSSTDVVLGTHEEILSQLDNFQLDAAFFLEPIDSSTLDCVKISKYDLVFACNKAHPFATKKSISIKELPEDGLITYQDSMPLAKSLKRLKAVRDLRLRQDYEDEAALCAAMVDNPDLVALLRFTSEVSLYPAIKPIALREVENEFFGTYFVFKKPPHRSPAVEAFIDYMSNIKFPSMESFYRSHPQVE